jgi:predicted small secreted protein
MDINIKAFLLGVGIGMLVIIIHNFLQKKKIRILELKHQKVIKRLYETEFE